MNEQTYITALGTPIKLEGFGDADISEKAQRRIDRLQRRIETRDADHNADQATIRSLTEQLERTEATLADVRDTGATFERGWHRATAETTELQGKLMSAQLNEAAAIARLGDDGLWSRKWQAEAEQQHQDYEALEAQLSDVRCRLVEARAEVRSLQCRNIWQRIINR
mgnify:FL=1